MLQILIIDHYFHSALLFYQENLNNILSLQIVLLSFIKQCSISLNFLLFLFEFIILLKSQKPT